MKKRLSLLAAALLLIVSLSSAMAEDRFSQVFDASRDAGLLTARYIRMTQSQGEKTGDATVLTSPDGQIMLLDAGLPEAAGQVVAALEAMGVSRIDYLVASHPHVDHIGGFAQIIRRFEIGAVYESALDYPSPYVSAFKEELVARGIPLVTLAEGDVFSFGAEVRAEVFHPAREISYYEGYPDNSTQFVNDHSLLLRLSWRDSSFLFGGDLYAGAERQLAEKYGERLKSDVFKVGHHGASTSSSKPYREAISPKIAVILSSRIEDIGVYQRYSKKGIDTYHSFLDGSIRVSTAGDGIYEVLTQQERATDFL